MTDKKQATFRIKEHPILPVEERKTIKFYWQGNKLQALEGETISSALFAHGIRIFGHHQKDGAPQGMFCANGQCSQCLVFADGLPVKSCMALVEPGMRVEPVEGHPRLPRVGQAPGFQPPQEMEVECLIIGGGPAGLSAAVELGALGVQTLLVDDKHRLGGKLILQTHKFFGSIEDCYAGTRGIDIATLLQDQLSGQESVECWLNANAVAVFSDHKVGVVRDGQEYVLIRPQALLVAAGAREKPLAFKGNSLPGVYGAGAFQTLVNRDLVRSAEKLFIVGGGNVGLIAGYHALQAGISVVGLVEALPACGGYKVHEDKLVRFGVPIYTSHTIVSANGSTGLAKVGGECVESVTIAQIDENWQAIPGTERSFECDTVLIAVGLDPVDEFYHKALEYGMKVFAAGDAQEIAEASAAMFSGKIKGIQIAQALGRDVPEIPPDWIRTEEILKSKPGAICEEHIPEKQTGVFPVFHCNQEIPCNPCISVCPLQAITVGDDIRNVPQYVGEQLEKGCTGCGQCVLICPGLAITLVDYRKDAENPTVTMVHEFSKESIAQGDLVMALDTVGQELGQIEVTRVTASPKFDRALLVRLQAPQEIAKQIAGIRVQWEEVTEPMDLYVECMTDDTIICRCGRVSAGEIRELIRSGAFDINEIKTVTRAGMGACGSKTCHNLIKRLFREEGIPPDQVTENVYRPLFVEVPLGVFCGTEVE